MPPILVDDSIVGEHEKFLIYGSFGTGKTFAAGTMPGTIFSLVLGGKNELKTYRAPDFLKAHPEKDGMIYMDWVREKIGRRGIVSKAEAYDIACDKLDEALDLEKKGDFQFDSLVIDAATGLRNVAMNKAIEITHDMAKGKEKTALTRLKDYGIRMPQDQDYGSEQSLIWKFVNWVFELEKHVCLITHEWIEAKTDRGTRTQTVISRKPLFTGKHRTDIPMMFDNVWRFSVSSGERSRQFDVQTIGDDIIEAKTRYGGVLGPMERNINFEKVIERFKNWRENEARKKTEKTQRQKSQRR